MNIAGCANCFLHGWKQVEDLRTLQRCTKCKLIQYCGKECQDEHWQRIHKKQCKYFADPAKAQRCGHREEDCVICTRAAQVGKADLAKATNLNYECILKEKFPPHMYHPHPFPVTGQPGNTREKGFIVLWQLLKKFELTQPGIVSSCQGKLLKVFVELKTIRLDIWKSKKIGNQMEWHLRVRSLKELLNTIRGNGGSDDSVEALIQIIELVNKLLLDVKLAELLQQVLIDPLSDIPDDLHTIVSQALNNSSKFLAMANQVLDALSAQVVPYQDLLMIICGGTLDKSCYFCSEKTTIANLSFCEIGSIAFFDCMFTEIYRCGSVICRVKEKSMMKDYLQLEAAVMTVAIQRTSTRCDFCLKLPPSQGGHRCSRCLTVMYCSITCRDQDWETHKKFCKKDAEERKMKFGSSGRRKEAREVLDESEKRMVKALEGFEARNNQVTQGISRGVCEVFSKLKLKDASKETKVLKQGRQEKNDSNKCSTGLGDVEEMTESEVQDGAGKLIPDDLGKAKQTKKAKKIT